MFKQEVGTRSRVRQVGPRRHALIVAIGLALSAAAGADDAAAPPTPQTQTPIRALSARARLRALELLRKQDPFEPVNRVTYKFNDVLDRAMLRPIARSYRAIVPIPARAAISNFIANLEYPTVIINDALQGKLRDAASDTARFVLNTVVGIGGLWDPAGRVGFASHDEDFGQTLGHWGVGPGPYLMLPFLGPSDLRDAPARYVSRYTNLEYLPESTKTQYALIGLSLLDRRTELLSTDEVIDTAFDPYALVRNAYLARREYLVRDGVVPEETYDDPLDTPLSEPAAASPATKAGPVTEAGPGAAAAAPAAAEAAPAQAEPAAAPAPAQDPRPPATPEG